MPRKQGSKALKQIAATLCRSRSTNPSTACEFPHCRQEEPMSRTIVLEFVIHWIADVAQYPTVRFSRTLAPLEP
jgi:hypothetical protein